MLRNLTVGVDKYILFPPGVDFGKMLMTPIGEFGPPSLSKVFTICDVPLKQVAQVRALFI
jgi:hypothetical protein